LVYLGTQCLGNRLQVIATIAVGCCSKARDCSSFAVALKAGRGKNYARVQPRRGLDDYEAGARQLHRGRERRDLLAYAFDPGVAPAQEKRHVRAQRQPNALERARGRRKSHSRLSASSVVAASEEPPPMPA